MNFFKNYVTYDSYSQMPQIPLCRYMLDNLFTLCHGPAWFVRLGGAGGFLYVSDMFPAEFLAVYQKMIVKGCIEV